LNVKDRSYNQPCWEMDRRSPDWRMRSPSDEGETMRNSPERGPLGPGGIVRRWSPAHRGGRPFGRGDSEGESQLSGNVVDVRITLKPPLAMGRLSAELCGAWNLEPYWGKPTVRNFRGGGWKRDHGRRTEAHAERRGTATGPYRARASAPPDNMPGTPRPDPVSTKRQRIAELARNGPDMAFTNLAHHIDIEWLHTAYTQTRKDGAVGVDGQTAEDYEINLEDNLQDLLNRAKSGTYVAPPVRRVHIPKAGSLTETRPLGIPTFEDKILQRAVLMVLEPVYETDFLDVSHGFRPGRGAHGALDSLWKQAMKLGGDWIVDVDLRKFFDPAS